jgi:hypothetical protein
MVALERFDLSRWDSPDYRGYWFYDCLIIPARAHLDRIDFCGLKQGRAVRVDTYMAREALHFINLQWHAPDAWEQREPALQLIRETTEAGDEIFMMIQTIKQVA